MAVLNYHRERVKSSGMELLVEDAFGGMPQLVLEHLHDMRNLVDGLIKYLGANLGNPFAIVCLNATALLPQVFTPEFNKVWDDCCALIQKIVARGYRITDTSYYNCNTLLEQVLQEWGSFQTYQDLSRLRQQIIQANLGPILAVYDAQPDLDLAKYLQYLWYSQQVQEFYRNPEIRGFTPQVFAEWTLSFKEMDEQIKSYNQDCLRVQHAKQMHVIKTARDSVPLLQQLPRKRHNVGVRQALAQYAPIQQIKPIILASPASVAAYLDPKLPLFDLVVFDEASQITPAHAIGAIQRGKQYVIVGDDQQLPPTRFFLAEDDDDVAEELPESILTMALGRGIHQQMLRWHYRSQHPDLIRVSNAEFY